MLKQAMVKTGAIFAALTVVALAAPAHAEPPMESQQPVVVVTDFSGSMNEADADEAGTTRIAAAKAAVKNLLAEAPDGSRLGLVAYGANNDSCGDIETVHPVGEFDAAELGARVDALEAKGNTPIGPALKHAAKDLASIEGPRSIVLVSDGEPNCEPPPACDVAKELAAQGIDMTVHTIGFRLAGNAKAQETLQCIADSTGGKYTHVETSEDLQAVLEDETTRAMQGYEAMGTPVEGGPVASKAEPLIAGQYVTKMATGDVMFPSLDEGEIERPNVRWFSVPHHDGWETRVAATIVPPSGEAMWVNAGMRHLEVIDFGKDGRCASRSTNAYGYQDGAQNPTDLTGVIAPEEGANLERCLNDNNDRVIAIARSGEGWAEHELDVEIVVTYRRSNGASSDANDEASTTDAPAGPAAATGGASFNNASELRAGEMVEDTILPGERRYFKLPVAVGQNLQVQVDFPDAIDDLNSFHLSVFNPFREQLWLPANEFSTMSKYLSQRPFKGEAKPMITTFEGPVDPANEKGDEKARMLSTPGGYYVVVARANGSPEGEGEVTYQVTLDTEGESKESAVRLVMNAEEYVAEFGQNESGTDGRLSSGEASSATAAAETEASASAEREDSGESQTTEASNEGGAIPWAPVIGGAGVALIAGGGAWYGLRRRS